MKQIMFVWCAFLFLSAASANLVPNMDQVQSAIKDEGFIALVLECPIFDQYWYYHDEYHNIYNDAVVEKPGQLVRAIDTVCSTRYGTIRKTILWDVFSDEYSYKRVLTDSLQNNNVFW